MLRLQLIFYFPDRLGLTLSANPSNRVSTRQAPKEYLIDRAEVVSDLLSASTSFNIRDSKTNFVYLVAVFFDLSFEVLEMVRVAYEVVKELATQPAATFRFR